MQKNLSPTYQCYTLYLKYKMSGSKIKYTVDKWEITPRVSLYGALHIAADTHNCTLIGVLPNDEKHMGRYTRPFSKNVSSIVGIGDKYYGSLTVCVISKIPKKPKKIYIQGDLSFHNAPHTYSISVSKIFLKYQLPKLVEESKKEYLKVWNKDSSLWGPLSQIPTGFRHVKRGIVRPDDYYFNKDSWTRCDVSFSPLTPGKKIEKQTMAYIKHTKEGKRYTACVDRYYNEFIIRKI